MGTNSASRGLCHHALEACGPSCPLFGFLVALACASILVKTGHER
jgi:hypothetical protein